MHRSVRIGRHVPPRLEFEPCPTFTAFRKLLPLLVRAESKSVSRFDSASASVELLDGLDTIQRMPSFAAGDRLPDDCYVAKVDNSEKLTMGRTFDAIRNVKTTTNRQIVGGLVRAGKAHAKADAAN